ncbi:CRISPR-associated primase-polymerase type A1 [Desulfonatronovibrio magnus]|uniref:CRISPR-associated primase-polymerase type A1 n=1 Tax=Desulfonatronovibrio magnus TaxID=698827 RepID=UPI00069721BC|nr:CRISPR-associated primase-polymerase type A1 [Desulfonatronovibrio magnus]
MNTLPLINKKSKAAKPDYNLLTTRLKQMALKGTDHEKCLSTLKKKALYDHLNPDQLLTWADIALVLGETEQALSILAWCNDSQPQFTEAWKKHFELLQGLGRSESAHSVKARAIITHPDLEKSFDHHTPLQNHVYEPDVDDPFAKLRHHNEMLELYMNYFQGREDVFARQWVDKSKGTQGYMPVRKPISQQDILEHLKGRKTYGIYLLRADSTIMTAVIDMDLNKHFRTGDIKNNDKFNIKREKDYIMSRLKEMSAQNTGVPPLCEFSGGKGYHFWFFFEEPVASSMARKTIIAMTSALNRDCQYFNLEVFPKQDQLQGKGLGNLVKLPLGIHRVSGKPSYFLGGNGKDPWTNISLLKKHPRISVKQVQSQAVTKHKTPVTLHPGYAKWAEKYPELHILTENCPPLGKIITALRGSKELGIREEKVIFQTIGFLSRARLLMHALMGNTSDYNSHLVDYKLSRIRGTPLGCKKIHQLLGINLDYCEFQQSGRYLHPLLHCPDHMPADQVKAERIENLNDALDHLRISLEMVQKFLPQNT